MLDIVRIKQNPDEVAQALAKKGCEVDFAQVIAWDNERKAKINEVEQLKARRNKVSAEIPALKKAGKPVEPIFEEMRHIGDEIAETEFQRVCGKFFRSPAFALANKNGIGYLQCVLAGHTDYTDTTCPYGR